MKVPWPEKTSLTWLLLSLSLLLLLTTKVVYTSANDFSRLFSVSSLVDHGRLWVSPVDYLNLPVDNYRVDWPIGDFIYNGQHWYSDKPPLFQIITAGFYGLANWLAGGQLQPPHTNYPNLSYYLLTFLLGGLPLILLCHLFYQQLKRLQLSAKTRLGFTLLLGFDSLLLPFATVFNVHILSALLIFIIFSLNLQSNDKKSLAACLLTGLLINIDPLSGFFVLLGTALFLIYHFSKQRVGAFVGGLIPGLLILLLFNYLTTATLLPMYLMSRLYLSLPENQWRTDLNFLPWPRLLKNYWLALTSEHFGLLFYSPYLIFCFTNLKTKISKLVSAARFYSLIGLIYLIFIVLITTDLGGATRGLRWSIPFIPIWLYLIASNWSGLPRPAKYLLILTALWGLGPIALSLTDPWRIGTSFSFINIFSQLFH